METKPKGALGPEPWGSEAAPSPRQAGQVREILQVLTNAIQAYRLFPPDHQSVVNFISTLHERLAAYLEEYGDLEIGIEEQAFTFVGKRLYEDPETAKSLPFFFFKDGMRSLTFVRGLQRDELRGLLETIRAVSALPAEEGDIVNALWEKDFPNIRHEAPDGYLETKIGRGRPAFEWRVDHQALERGRIELSPEDLEAIRGGILAMQRGELSLPEEAQGLEPEEDTGEAPPSNQSEAEEIEALIAANRRLSPEDEYLRLIIEIIYLEERSVEFPGLEELATGYQRDLIARGDFVRAARLVRSILELRRELGERDPDKSSLLARILEDTRGPAMIAELKSVLTERGGGDAAVFGYLGLVGPAAARLVADLFEQGKTHHSREAALETLKKMGEEDLGALISLPQDSKPVLARSLIPLIGESCDKRVLPFLAGFLNSKNVSLRLEAARTLGRTPDAAADRVLQGFVSDEEESVRIAALEGLRPTGDERVVRHVLDAVGGEAGLKNKSKAEREAFLAYLGRSRSGQACAWLGRILGRSPFLPDRRHTDLCLSIAEALAAIPLVEARQALERGAKRRQPRVRQACLAALETWPGTQGRGSAGTRPR